MTLSIGGNDALGFQSWSTEYSAASRLQDATRSTSSSNWGDRAAAFSLKAMVAEAGARISGITTEEDLARTRFGECPRMTLLRARAASDPAVDDSAGHPSRAPPRLQGCGSDRGQPGHSGALGGLWPAADLVMAESNGPWPWLRAAIREADLVVIHGDGAMVGEGIIPRTDLFLAYLAHERLDTPVVLVNHSADFDRPELRRMAEHVYPLFADLQGVAETVPFRERSPDRIAPSKSHPVDEKSGSGIPVHA